MRCIIAGGRDFKNFELLVQKCDYYLRINKPSEIISGTADGADYLGERYAAIRNIPVKKFEADWKRNGRKAGPIRNQQMAEYATHLIVFWDGKSRGTKNMIEFAEKYNLQTRIIRY